uniref:C2H2-type domain-containing protein n=1 Tax=Panagrellus redivivus TaxID=6233 RepID=A0A7E4W8C2_PANRE
MNSYHSGETESIIGSPRLEFSNLNTFNMHDYNPDLNSVKAETEVRLTLDVPKDEDEKSGSESEEEIVGDETQPKQEPLPILNAPPSFYEYNYYLQQANHMAATMPLSFPMPVPPPIQQFGENFQNAINQQTSNESTPPNWAATSPPSDTSSEEASETPPPSFTDADLTPENIEAATKFLAGKRACPVCKKEFKVSHGLRGHYTRVHMRQKRFTCPVCQLGFWSNSDLERHMPRHTGQRFTCDTCDRTYTSKQRLTEHFRNPSPCWLDPVFLKHVTESADAQRFL